MGGLEGQGGDRERGRSGRGVLRPGRGSQRVITTKLWQSGDVPDLSAWGRAVRRQSCQEEAEGRLSGGKTVGGSLGEGSQEAGVSEGSYGRAVRRQGCQEEAE